MMLYRHRKNVRIGISLLTALFLMIGLLGPISAPVASADGDELPEYRIRVTDVDSLLAAIGSDRVIEIADGEYNLTMARSYGKESYSDSWYWEDGYDGYQLRLRGLHDLRFEGSGRELCSIVTEPRYANVMHFTDCENISIADITAGHTPGEGYCSGGVLDFADCRSIRISGCELFGCGTWGINAVNCSSLIADGCIIRNCSYGAVSASSCLDVRFQNGSIFDCGLSKEFGDDWIAFQLLEASTCTGFAVLNTEIFGNIAQTAFQSSSTVGFFVGGCRVHDNSIGEHGTYSDEFGKQHDYNWGGMFRVSGQPASVIGTEFQNNQLAVPFFFYDEEDSFPAPDSQVTDPDGNPLDQSQLESMTHEDYDCADYEVPASVSDAWQSEGSITHAGLKEYHVTTTDEFLSAIGSNTVIYVDAPLIDFSAASNYGGYGGTSYYWLDIYDGPGLVISGVNNLQIIGQGREQTMLQATPRYAEVLYFENCSDLLISGLTAGHLKEAPGYCGGDVFEFTGCHDVIVEDCGLFGCGVNAISAESSSDFSIRNTEMYECSQYGAILWSCDHFAFESCVVRDCGANGLELIDTHHITWDGQRLADGYIEF